MKKFAPLIALCLTLCLALFGGAKLAQAQPTIGTITVTGSGQVALAPDTATISFGMVTTADTLENANQENNQKVAKVRQTLLDNKIAEKDIQTKNFYAHQEYAYENNQEVAKGYRISNEIVAKTTNLDGLTQIIGAAMADGANEFYGVWFESSQMSASYQTALQNALADAKQKAQTLSGMADMNMIEVVEETVWTHLNHKQFAATEASADQAFFGGEIVVKAQVKVVFGNGVQPSTNQNATTTKSLPEPHVEPKQNDANLSKEPKPLAEPKINVEEPVRPTQPITEPKNTQEANEQQNTNQPTNNEQMIKNDQNTEQASTKVEKVAMDERKIRVEEPTDLQKPLIEPKVDTKTAEKQSPIKPNRIPRSKTLPQVLSNLF